ncbi:MAG TPA: 30S ribosomal protein S12 methylthiotransferase RimO [Bacteroidales bacterium]|nr:30S ribosomal protein S12 methylthiotransferase RimO [Bacteroidales bacterium]
MESNNIKIYTLGCYKNQVDSEKLAGKIEKSGGEVVHTDKFEGNTFILNTCGFIGDAKEESIEAIMQAIKAKKEGKIRRIVVMGCLSERYKKELEQEIPEVDAWFGVDSFDQISYWLNLPKYQETGIARKLANPSHYAYLKIAEGCSRKCSFCAIPNIRGSHHSRPINEIMDEAQWLASKGVKEIILISQDLTSYGIDLYKKQMITQLVSQLSESHLFPWIRLHYLFPASFPEVLLHLMATHENICPYIDIPLQHISDRILKSMHRGIDKASTIALIEKFRNLMPHAALRSTFIIGYPGETNKEFNELLNFISDVRFERVGVFTYSEEEGTAAALLNDDVDETTKNLRAEKLMEIQSKISLEKNVALIGKTLEVLIDRKEGDYFIGRTRYDSPEIDNEVWVKSTSAQLQIGQFYPVFIERADLYEIYGKPC